MPAIAKLPPISPGSLSRAGSATQKKENVVRPKSGLSSSNPANTTVNNRESKDQTANIGSTLNKDSFRSHAENAKSQEKPDILPTRSLKEHSLVHDLCTSALREGCVKTYQVLFSLTHVLSQERRPSSSSKATDGAAANAQSYSEIPASMQNDTIYWNRLEKLKALLVVQEKICRTGMQGFSFLFFFLKKN